MCSKCLPIGQKVYTICLYILIKIQKINVREQFYTTETDGD